MIPKRCKGVHCVDLGESFPTHIFLQNLASIWPITSPVKVARSLRTDSPGNPRASDAHLLHVLLQVDRQRVREGLEPVELRNMGARARDQPRKRVQARGPLALLGEAERLAWAANKRFEISKFIFKLRRARTYEMIGLVLGCIDAKFCK